MHIDACSLEALGQAKRSRSHGEFGARIGLKALVVIYTRPAQPIVDIVPV